LLLTAPTLQAQFVELDQIIPQAAPVCQAFFAKSFVKITGKCKINIFDTAQLPFYNKAVGVAESMNPLATNRESTIVRPIETADVRRLMRLLDTSWRVHLRLAPVELHAKTKQNPGLVAEDDVGLRGFMMIEPLSSSVALLIAAGLRDTWSVQPFLDVLLPEMEKVAREHNLKALVYIGNASWLVDELRARRFETREWIVAFERFGQDPPPQPPQLPAHIRTAHNSDLPVLLELDDLAFDHIGHKTAGNFSEALARADSFKVAIIDDQIVAYEWCELYGLRAHLTRLAVHPQYQGRGIGAQLLYHAITDALAAGAQRITLNTQENNYRSRALYERFGFAFNQQRMPVLWKDLG
jgi:ribosomal-protein-alanine N-acetyltransferase